MTNQQLDFINDPGGGTITIGVPQETSPGEKRVAIVPDTVPHLLALGFSVTVQHGAGAAAGFDDAGYRAAGARIAPNVDSLWTTSHLILKVTPPSVEEVALMREGSALIAFIAPAQNAELLTILAQKRITTLAMDSIPRLSRAQKMDALSSMANVAGYRAVIEAAQHYERFFSGQMSAAGRIPPARVFVIGAGVAGLSAISTATSLGAQVRANDTRPEVADQIRSLGADWVSIAYQEDGRGSGGYAKVMSETFQQAQRAVFAQQSQEVDIIITTALIPGKPAPQLISEDMVRSMRPGSVIVDLAAGQGGNCACTRPDKVVVRHGVTIIGYTNLPSRMAYQSSALYASNLLRLVEAVCPQKEGHLHIDMADEVIRGATVTHDYQVTWPPPVTPAPATVAPTSTVAASVTKQKPAPVPRYGWAMWGGILVVLGALANTGLPADFLHHLSVFVLACFVGYMVVWNVTPALHTPLMSVTNAISSIIVIGAVMQLPSPGVKILALGAIFLTAINSVGGFTVTQRMLKMFRK